MKTTRIIILVAFFPVLIAIIFLIVSQQNTSSQPLIPLPEATVEITDEIRARYLPSTYGLPDAIAGYPVLAIISSVNTDCYPEGRFELVIQIIEMNQDEYLNSNIPRKIQDAINAMGRSDLTFGVTTGSTGNLDVLIAETERWNQVRRVDGCIMHLPPSFSSPVFEDH